MVSFQSAAIWGSEYMLAARRQVASEWVEVISVQLPGREDRVSEVALTEMSSVVDGILSEIGPFLDRPLVLFGYSVGALIAFEVAQELSDRVGYVPSKLVVAALGAPHLPNPNPELHRLPDEELLSALDELDGIPQQIRATPALLTLLLPTLRADHQLKETYVYRHRDPLGCPIQAFGGLDDPLVDQVRLRGWGEQTSSGFDMKVYPGDHFFLKTQEANVLEVLVRGLSS